MPVRGQILYRFAALSESWRRPAIVALAIVLTACGVFAGLMLLVTFGEGGGKHPGEAAKPAAAARKLPDDSSDAPPSPNAIRSAASAAAVIDNRSIPSSSGQSTYLGMPSKEIFEQAQAYYKSFVAEGNALPPPRTDQKIASKPAETPPLPPKRNADEKAQGAAPSAAVSAAAEDRKQNASAAPAEAQKPPGMEARKTAAMQLERSYADAGLPITAAVSGEDGTVLDLQYANFNEALVAKMMTVPSFATTVRKLGFTKIVFAAGPDKTWTRTIKRSSAPPEEPSPPDETPAR